MELMRAALFDELTPIYPDSNPDEGSSSYQVAGANGSYAGVHILFSGLTPGIPLSLDVKGSHRAYKLFELKPVPVEVNTGASQRTEYLHDDYNENVIRRAPFMVYEALEPVFNIVMPCLTTAAFAFRTPIEYCRSRRKREWKFTLTHGSQKKELSFSVEEYPVSIEKANRNTFQFVNWINFQNIADVHHVSMWSKKYVLILERYLRAAAYTRQNILALGGSSIFDLDENGNPKLNEPHILTLVQTAQKAGISLFQGGALCTRAESLNDDDRFYESLDHASFQSPEEINEAFKKRAFDLFDYGKDAVFSLTGVSVSTVKGEEQLRSALRQLNEFINRHHLRESWTQCCMDEPNDALKDVYLLISKITREEMPGIPILEPVLPTKSIIGALDIWCPSINIYEQNRDFFDERVKAGDRLYVYTCLTPGGNYCNRLLDMERLRVVYLAWAAIEYPNIEGYLHWGMNETCQNDPFCRQAAMFSEQVLEYHPKYANFLPAGDECIFYPGYDIPLTSTRSEAHRIGFEDLYLLQKIAALDEERAKEIVHRLFRGFADYSKSVQEYRLAREELFHTALSLL